MKFVVCISREDCGEDYLYPAGLFETVEVQERNCDSPARLIGGVNVRAMLCNSLISTFHDHQWNGTREHSALTESQLAFFEILFQGWHRLAVKATPAP